MKAGRYQSLSLQLGLGTDLWYQYQALIKLQGIPIPNKQMYTGSASLCLPPIAIEMIVIRPLRERVLEFTADRNRLHNVICKSVCWISYNKYTKHKLMWWIPMKFTADCDRCYCNLLPASASNFGFTNQCQQNLPLVGARVQFITQVLPFSRQKYVCKSFDRQTEWKTQIGQFKQLKKHLICKLNGT